MRKLRVYKNFDTLIHDSLNNNNNNNDEKNKE